MRFTAVGCGDAFGSGARANTCFLVETAATTIALDFGATSLVALKRLGLDPNCIDAVMLFTATTSAGFRFSCSTRSSTAIAKSRSPSSARSARKSA